MLTVSMNIEFAYAKMKSRRLRLNYMQNRWGLCRWNKMFLFQFPESLSLSEYRHYYWAHRHMHRKKNNSVFVIAIGCSWIRCRSCRRRRRRHTFGKQNVHFFFSEWRVCAQVILFIFDRMNQATVVMLMLQQSFQCRICRHAPDELAETL